MLAGYNNGHGGWRCGCLVLLHVKIQPASQAKPSVYLILQVLKTLPDVINKDKTNNYLNW